MAVSLTGYLEVPEARLEAVLAAMEEHVRLSRAEPGCLSFELRQDPARPARLLVSERFCDHAAFAAHQARMKASAWADITQGITRHFQISETD